MWNGCMFIYVQHHMLHYLALQSAVSYAEAALLWCFKAMGAAVWVNFAVMTMSGLEQICRTVVLVLYVTQTACVPKQSCALGCCIKHRLRSMCMRGVLC